MMASCTFESGSQLTVRYSNAVPANKRDLPNGKIWSPGDVPMLLFTEKPIIVGGATELPIGAYSLYVIPDKDKWTLIVNRNVAVGAPYDEKQDVVRVPMSIGKLPTPLLQPQVALGHIQPKLCSLRVDYAKLGVWADVFREK
jgi:hypothetical protein